MTASKLLLAAAALVTVQAELLRGNLPDKKELKRLNLQRHQLNAARDKKELEIEKSAWQELSKEEKKEILEELKREEERVADDEEEEKKKKKNKDKSKNKDKGKEDDKEKNTPQSSIHEYHTLLDTEIKPNELNAIWKSLSKEEKKQVLALQEGRLIFDNKGNLIDNPDYIMEKLTKEEKKEMMKAEKEKDENKPSKGDEPNENEEDMQPNSQAKPSSNPEKDDMKPNNSAANTFVNTKPILIDYQPEVEETTSTTSTTTTTKKPKETEEDMTPNSQAKPNEANDFVNPMPSITFSSSAATTTTTSTTTTSAKVTTTTQDSEEDTEVTSTYTFAKELPDPSTPLNQSEEHWTMDGLPWITQTTGCYTDSCVLSGINESMGPTGVPVYSNLTLTTEKIFKGGIFTFLVQGKTRLPNEVFVVTVDEEVASSVISENDKWVEYGVVVEQGKHKVTWSHISNPLGLTAVPFHSGGALMVDDLRYSPFQKFGQDGIQQDFEGEDGLIMTLDGDATWKVYGHSGLHSILASTDDIDGESGSSNVNFELYSKEGGTLKYNISTSTTAPHDDFVILLNGKPVEAVFGLMPNFEKKTLDIPGGKVVVTFQHRKNPGKLSKNVLEALGTVKTEGYTKLDDVSFKTK